MSRQATRVHVVSELHHTLKLSFPLIELLVSSVQTGTTALFFAAQGGFLDIAQILMERRAPVDSSSVVGADMLTVDINWQTRQPERSLQHTSTPSPFSSLLFSYIHINVISPSVCLSSLPKYQHMFSSPKRLTLALGPT
jgi:hypothetical protein